MDQRRRKIYGLTAVVAVYLIVAYVIPRPERIQPGSWRLTGLFLATVMGSILEPLPGGALVLIAITAAPLVGGLTLGEALSGFGDATVWLVMAAFFISRALVDTGLARRIALGFVRWFGQSTLGVCYALGASDMVLATIIPANGARSGGVILPIARSIAELYGSKPGETAGRMGSFLMAGVYQTICVTAAMFYTGQASNPLAAKMAGGIGYNVTWLGWLIAAVVPGMVSMLLVPWISMRLYPPEVKRTPEAAEFARRELEKMGPMSGQEKMLAVVFAAVCGAWVSSSWTHIDITVAALCGTAALLLTGVLPWERVVSDKAAWNILIWYGGLVRLGRALQEKGVAGEFARGVGETFSGLAWLPLLAVAVLILYYSHYAFASITAHMLAMYGPFLALLTAKGAPAGLAVYALASAVNLSAGLTNYGTTPAPMFYAQGYVPLKDWWRVGFVVSLTHVAVWGTVGFAWWKLLGLW